MLISFIRVIILYVLVLFTLRVMGKRQISEFQPHELVITIMIADIATEPLGDVNIPLLNGVIPIVVFIFLQVTISFLTYKNEKIRKFICGGPSVIIKDGKVQQKKMKDMLIGIDDLCEQLRNINAQNIDDIDFLILEANGNPSLIKKDDEGLLVSLIKYGKRENDNFNLVSVTPKDLDNKLKGMGIKDDKEVFWAYCISDKINVIKFKEE